MGRIARRTRRGGCTAGSTRRVPSRSYPSRPALKARTCILSLLEGAVEAYLVLRRRSCIRRTELRRLHAHLRAYNAPKRPTCGATPAALHMQYQTSRYASQTLCDERRSCQVSFARTTQIAAVDAAKPAQVSCSRALRCLSV